MKTIEQMVQQEVSCCLSSLVATLATGDAQAGTDLAELCDRALGLAMPVPDYEEAAIQAGYVGQQRASDYRVMLDKNGQHVYGIICATAEEAWRHACDDNHIDPIESEVYEHWAVSDWLAHKLLTHGEKVDTDFANLKVWARRSKDQQISADDVMVRIYAKMMA